jgi:hypothetical protein
MHTESSTKFHGGAGRRFSDPRIIEFRPRPRSDRRAPPPLVDPIRQFEIDAAHRRMQQNLAAVVVLVLLVAGGLWLFQQLKESSRILACLEADHRDCLQLDETRWR